MATLYSPKIATDGLVLLLDAANSKSYPRSGTTWTDVSGNGNTGTLTNGPTFNIQNGGSIVFDGIDDNVVVNDTSLLDLSGNKSLAAWVYMGAYTSAAGICGKANFTVNGMALGYGFSGNGFMALAWNSSNNPGIAPDESRDVNKWNYVVGVQDGSVRYIYVYDSIGLRTQSFSGGVHSWDNTEPFLIGTVGSVSGIPVPANTRIANVSIYNRALSTNEILQNFNATRSRFGV